MVTCLSQTGTSCSGIPGVNPSHFAVTSPLSTHDIFEIQVMLHNNYWGVPMNYGLDSGCTIPVAVGAGVNDATCPGVSIRQAVAHLIDKVQYCASNGIVVCSAVDNGSSLTAGLVTADPCGWDVLFPQTGSNCVVGSPGGTAYHLSPSTSVGHDTGAVAATYSWEPATDNGGKADLCAAAQHLVTAGVASGFDTTTCVLTGISVNAAAHPVNIFARSDRPARLALGDGLMESICYLFTGHYSAETFQQIPTTTTACPGTFYVTETRGPIAAFPGFTTSNIGCSPTAFASPSTNPGTSTWTNPQNGFALDQVYTTSGGSGSNNALAFYGGYRVCLPSGGTISKVEIGIYGHQAMPPTPNDQVRVEYSVTAGVTWNLAGLFMPGTSDTNVFFDVTGQQSWNGALLSTANFEVRMTHVVAGSKNTISVDWIPLRITVSPPSDNWWIYAGGYGSVFPYDSLLYGQFNSQFVSGGAWDQPPCSSLAVPSTGATNYEYACVPAYDTISHAMEFSPCATAAGDPSPGQTRTTVTFGNCSSPVALSAQSAGYQTEDMYGKLELWIPIYGPSEQFGYLAKWNTVINSQGLSVPNFFTWLNAHSAGLNSVTQAFAAPTKSLNPYASSTVFDFQTIGVIYDSLGSLNPAQNGQYFDYLASGHSTPCNTNLSIPCDLAHLGYTPPAGTVATVRFSLRPDIFWQSDSVGSAHPARPMTSWDVAFSYITLKATGSFQGGVLSPMIDVHVLDKANFDINLNAIGPFTLLSITAPTIFPGRYWSSTCSGTTWDSDVNAGSVPTSCMAVTNGMSTITFDPLSSAPNNGVATGILIGSSAYECQSAGGIVGGGGCSSTGVQNPPGGGAYTMTRFGCSRVTGNCNAPGANPTSTYFRSAGTLALAIWAGTNGDANHDSVIVGSAAFCFNKAVGTAGCTQWQRGIGNPGTGTPVNVAQVSAVIRFSQDGNFISPFNWLPGIPAACCPFTSNPPVGIQSATPVLFEGTATLNPCSIDSVNGYDC